MNIVTKNIKTVYIIGLALIILRLAFGFLVGNWFPSSQSADDALLISYTDLGMHFYCPNSTSLLKYMGFPIFLLICGLSHIPYSIFVSLLWVCDAILVYYLIKTIKLKKIKEKIKSYIASFFFVYTLFLPVAFEQWAGTRLYRNSVLAPLVLLTFALLFLLLIKFSYNTKRGINNKKLRPKLLLQILLISVCLGIILTLTYYIKEDGIWLLACTGFLLLIFSIYWIIPVIKRKNLYLCKYLIILLIPLLILGFATFAYKSINKHFFGVFETETRTKGEFGKYVSNIYKIKSDSRTADVWAPLDAIEKTFEVSETLKQYPQLLDKIKKSPWSDGNIYAKPIRGDYLGWTLRWALDETHLWENEKQVSDLFHQVNTELDNAFQNKLIEKDTKIQLISSAGGRSINEIIELKRLMYYSLRGAITLYDYTPGLIYGDCINPTAVNRAIWLTHDPYISSPDKNIEELSWVNDLINVLFVIYKVFNVLLALTILISSIICIYNKFSYRNKKIKSPENRLLFITMILFACYTLAYAFAISWFSSFIFENNCPPNMEILNFYCVCLPVILLVTYICSIFYVFNNFNTTRI